MERTPISINDMVAIILKVIGVNPRTKELKSNHKIEVEIENCKVTIISIFNKGLHNKSLIQYHNADGALIHYNWVVKQGWVECERFDFVALKKNYCAVIAEV